MPPESKPHHKVMLPVPEDHYGRVLDAGPCHVERRDGAFTIHYRDHRFPISPRSLPFLLTRVGSYAESDHLGFFATALDQLPSSRATDWESLRRRHRDKGILMTLFARFLREDQETAAAVDRAIEELNRDPQALHDLLERQNYRLAFWRTAERELAYRRFFDMNTLIGLRTEDEQVFADIHELVFRWLKPEGPVDGVRVDHTDGLPDPERCLVRLRDRVQSWWDHCRKDSDAERTVADVLARVRDDRL
jgi:(1->4)-alpha-D-glucan 1-alpha-D-glucosylmutase